MKILLVAVMVLVMAGVCQARCDCDDPREWTVIALDTNQTYHARCLETFLKWNGVRFCTVSDKKEVIVSGRFIVKEK